MEAQPPGSWLIYALGGGWGHLTRAVALARVAPPDRSVKILTNSPYARQVHQAMPALDLATLDPALPLDAARAEAVRKVVSAAPACLIVDTFPRGLGGELVGRLASAKFPKALVHRDLNPEYVTALDLHAFVKSTYDLVVIPGAEEGSAFADLSCSTVTAPWIIETSQRIAPPHPEPCVLVCAAGLPEESAWYGEVVSRLLQRSAAVQCIAPACPAGCPPEFWQPYWPAAELYSQADVVVGGAGYNTIYECLAYGMPLVARPWPRQYDRQARRAAWASRQGWVTVVKEIDEAVDAALHELSRGRPRGRPKFQNGARQAVARIAVYWPRNLW